MSNFVSTLLSICIHFLLVFLKFLLILILNKLVNSYTFPLGKTAMHRLKLSILFATLGQLAAKILVILYVYPIHFSAIFLFILMFILIFMNM